MARCLLDPLVGLKDGDYSPAHVGHHIGDVFHYKGVPMARRVGQIVLVRSIPYGMRPGHYLPAAPRHMWWTYPAPDPATSSGELSLTPELVPRPNVLFVQNLHPVSPCDEAMSYEENLMVYLTESVAGKFGRVRFARTHALKLWFNTLRHNRKLIGMPELDRAALKERFAPSVAVRQMKYPGYPDLNWEEILP